MNKLEVGMYVRTNTGMIDIIRTDLIGFDEAIGEKNVFCEKHIIEKTRIVKASHNIIDLIEEGDYVNGYLIEMFYDTYNPATEEEEDILGIAIYDDANMDCITEVRPLKTLDIKSIVTKEQFESMEYRLGE